MMEKKRLLVCGNGGGLPGACTRYKPLEDIVQFCARSAPPLERALGIIAWWPAFMEVLADRLGVSSRLLWTAQRQRQQQQQPQQNQHQHQH